MSPVERASFSAELPAGAAALGLQRATTYVQVLTLADASVSAAAQNQFAESEHPAASAHTQRLEDLRMNIVALVIVILGAYWLSSLIID